MHQSLLSFSLIITFNQNGKRKKSKPRPIPLDYVKDDQALPYEEEEEMGMSPLTQKKCMWTKMKGVLKGKRDEDGPLSLSVPSSPSSAAECLSFDFDLEKCKFWQSTDESNQVFLFLKQQYKQTVTTIVTLAGY